MACFAGLSWYVFTLTRNLYDDAEVEENLIDRRERPEDKYIEYTVRAGKFVVAETMDGYVMFDDDATSEIVIKNKEKIQMKVVTGEIIQKDDVLYLDGQKEVRSKVSGRVLEANQNSGVIRILDFSKSKIVVYMPESRQEFLRNTTKIFGTYREKEKANLDLLQMVPYVEEGRFAVYLKNVFEVFHNTKIQIDVEYITKENVVAVPKEYVKADIEGKKYVLLLKEGGSVSKIYVNIGEESSTQYEILGAEILIGQSIVYDKKEAVLNGK